ncbi:T9SS type A sorting domain-containing protein [candidate division WOR-3 bacterium]|nr:T9SS type A sorting domain-containing protein [candidate division WOR-3 bacterium]
MRRTSSMIVCAVLLPVLFLAAAPGVEKAREIRPDGSTEQHRIDAMMKQDLTDSRQTVIDSIPAPGTSHMGLAWDGTYLWNVSNATTPIVAYQIDPQTGTVVNTLTTAIYSYVLGCTYLNGSLWIQEWYTYGTTYEINPTTGAIVSSFTSPAGTSSRGLTNDGTYLWIMNAPGQIAYQVTTTGTVVRSVSMPMVQWAMDAAWNSQRGTLFLCDNSYANNIKELDVSGATAILLDEFPHPGAAYTPEGITYDGQYLWTTAFDAYWIWKIDIGDPSPSAVWDFEDGLQGWTHTNGLTFPAAWGVRSSLLHAGTWQIPASGDSSMWIDSDAAGSGVWVQDSALSPVLVPNASMDWLRYGVSYNWIASGEWLEVGLKYFNGTSWAVVPLKTYTADVTPTWDSVDVSAYSGYDQIQIYFYYDDNNIWAWYAAFDNVSIAATIATHDVGVSAITSPPAGGMVAAGSHPVTGRIKNFGHYTETFDATATVWDTTTWTQVFTQTVTLSNFASGADSLVTFGNVNFEMSRVYRTMIYTLLAGDENPANDTAVIHSATSTFNTVWDFETGLQGWTHTNGLPFPAGWDVQPSGLHPYYTPPNAGSYSMWIDSDAAGFVTLWDTAYSPAVAPSASTTYLKYGIGFLWYSGGNAEYVTVGVRPRTGGAWQTPVGLRTYYGTFGPAWDSVDVSAYQSADSLKVFFSYNDAYYEWCVAFDNVMINAQVGIEEQPGGAAPLAFGFASIANPARGQTAVAYALAQPGMVALKVYDRTGRLVQTLVNSAQPAGQHTVIWDTRNLSSGVYFLHLATDNQSATHKLILVD